MQTNVPLCILDNHDFYGAHQVFPLPLKFFGTWWTGWGSPGHPVSLSFRGFVLLLLQTPKREEPPIPSPQCLWDAQKDLDKGSLGSTQSCKTEACSTFSRPPDHDTLCVSQRTSEVEEKGVAATNNGLATESRQRFRNSAVTTTPHQLHHSICHIPVCKI